jgi:predicted MFS family arabinose efflux permease
MIAILKQRVFAQLFAAQVVALIGTGLLTIALGLLAYDLAGAQAGAVLGTAYTIKMVAYVGLSPLMGALAVRLPRRAVLIGADLVRLAVALCLPFVDSVGQVYLLIFALQAASATFTPTFQAVIPDVLPDEADYTRALSLSRLAYDLENLLSPALAGLLLVVISYGGLFVGTIVGFLISVVLIWGTVLPPRGPETARRFFARVTRGSWIYLSTPRLRGLLAFNTAAASAGAFVLVNSVVIARDTYGAGEGGLAVAMAAFGAGSMVAAFILPKMLEHVTDRQIMGTAAAILAAITLGHGWAFRTSGPLAWPMFLGLWALSGGLYSTIVTPSGRLLRRSAHASDRPAVFTAHFALSHASWLVTYPLAGWSGAHFGLPMSLLIMGGLALGATFAGLWLWRSDPEEILHEHINLPDAHPHLIAYGGRKHSHIVVIDDEHHVWPTNG